MTTADAILLGVLLIAAVGLTGYMAQTKNTMLGFPALILWSLTGSFSYAQSSSWDFYRIAGFAFIFIGVMLGGFGAYGLRKRDLSPGKRDWEDSEKYIDEDGKQADSKADDAKDSPKWEIDENIAEDTGRTQALRERTADRRESLHTGSRPKIKWGEFR